MLSSFPWPDGARILAKGDSTLDAAFSHQLISPIVENIRFTKNPFTRVGQVGARMPSGGFRNFAFINRGVSGQTLAAMNSTLASEIASLSPTHHICACGINDVQTAVPLATSQAQFTAYLDATCGVGKPTLFLLPFFWVGLGATVVTFNAAMMAIATAHAGRDNLMIVDQYAVLNAAVNSVLYTAPDSSIAHPNPAFRAALYTYLRPLVSA